MKQILKENKIKQQVSKISRRTFNLPFSNLITHLVGTISHGFEKSCLYGSNCRVLKGSDFWNSYIGIICTKKGLMKK